MVKVIIKAKYARFTQQGEKADCTTYPIPTPSSLIGLLTSVYGKPEFNWVIRSIKVLNEICIEQMQTNSLSYTKKNGNSAAKLVNSPVHGSYLRDVAYVVEAEPQIPDYYDNKCLSEGKNPKNDFKPCAPVNLPLKHINIFKRRVKNGHIGSERGALFLGKNNCPCTVELLEGEEPKSFYEGTGRRIFRSVPYVQSFTHVPKENVERVKKFYGRNGNNKIFRTFYSKNAEDERYFISNFHFTDLVMVDGLIKIDPALYEKHTTNNFHKVRH